MSAVPKFEEDVFISYARVDNQPFSDVKGWVDTLHERLRIRLTMLLGREVSIWRDPKLDPTVPFPPTIVGRIQNAAIFVSILSPRYPKSEWCLRELNEFREATKGNLLVGDKSRVVKVVKDYVPLKDHPAIFQDLLGYEFYVYDQERRRPEEFSPEIGPTRDIRYWAKLEDLAYGIKELIDTMCDRQSTSDGKAIYLAETTSDLHQEREQIKRELQQHRYVIFPDKPLPLVADLLRNAVRKYLSLSDLSVHLIGDRYGIIPEGEYKSIVHLQSELTAERSNGFEQIIWLPIGLQARDETQQRLIDSLKHGLNGHTGVELLQTKLEDLKTFIEEKLTACNPDSNVPTDENDRRLSIYLICDRQDLDATSPLADYLDKRGMDVILPATEGEETEVLDDHKMNLLECDAVLIYYGRANEVWLRMKQRELQKLAGYGRTTPLLAKGIFISAPPSDAKERIRDHEAVIIKNYEGFSPESLKPFLERMRQAKEHTDDSGNLEGNRGRDIAESFSRPSGI